MPDASYIQTLTPADECVDHGKDCMVEGHLCGERIWLCARCLDANPEYRDLVLDAFDA